MNIESNRIWMAYLDGELTPYEVITFEDSLPTATLKRLRQEFVLEDIITQKLPEVNCPDKLWHKIRFESKKWSKGRPWQALARKLYL